MRRGRAILSFALALLWLGLPVHCQLEAVASSAFLSCCIESCPSEQDSNCEEDFCGSLESAAYFPTKSPSLSKLPVLHVLFQNLPSALLISDTSPTHEIVSDRIPLLARSWQFVFRTVAPPRAPTSRA